MNDTVRECLSYPGIYKKMFQLKKQFIPRKVSYGKDKSQYFLYYEPEKIVSDKVIIWVHGGGWRSGSPLYFDLVGQCVAKEGYRFVSIGYRLAPKHKYPAQIEDVCHGYKAAVRYLKKKGIDTSKIVISGPSAGAHLTALLCCSEIIQKKYCVDVSEVIGFIGSGGPYCMDGKMSFAIKIMLDELYTKGYDREQGDACRLMTKTHIPMLLIQSRHDGLVEYSCAERMYEKAQQLGNQCELYSVVDKKNTHSWYTAGMFLETREENHGLDKFFSWIEKLESGKYK